MAPTGFSTKNLPPARQFDAWHEWFCPVFDISAQSQTGGQFLATNKVWDLGGLVASSVSAPSVLVSRKKDNIAKSPVDHWVLSCCRRGVTKIETNGALLNAPPGMPFIWSLGQQSESERSHVDRIQILLPRDMFRDTAAQLDALCGSTIDTPLGAVLGQYIIALEQWLPSLTPDLLPRLGAAVGSMIAACTAPSADRMDSASDEINGFRIERVRQVVFKHLKSPSLRPDMLCKMVGMSRSALYRLFEHSGGVARYIQRQRLLHAYAMLSDPLNRTPILVIGEELCFADPSSFSRAFRHEFGCSPKDVRLGASRGSSIAPMGRPCQTLDIACFGDFLRQPNSPSC